MQIIEILVGITLLIFAFLAIESKKIINSVIYLSILSMLSVVSFIFMKAPDVAITEAVIGSGLVTAIFIFTLFSIKKVGDKK
ncbi:MULTISPECIES: Na(+)/H(+) antiporter subunit B [unclassified Marinitoga]|uniref:Na(+)/H(+) antiporter subunit B n=1 Tax=unclassified Marinitoga TaxID=2640159 RepID=UPI00064112AB|nr:MULTISPECIES: hydrogenase subunit MbhD domain-containing protein [unclassified Marinitoga]KLO25002.1 sodium:proton antiporter [Marinitoga sp. 1155]NUU98725.1 sodium:proton antiporter [Marinitoga sp. 1154]